MLHLILGMTVFALTLFALAMLFLNSAGFLALMTIITATIIGYAK